jgi:hypothetical protein
MPAMTLDLPFQPIRSNLYSSRELMDAYDPNDPTSMGRTLDFRSYRYFTVAGGAVPKDPYAGMMESLHDNSIMRAMTTFQARRKDQLSPSWVVTARSETPQLCHCRWRSPGN